MARRVGLYARVSTADQKTGLESQIRALKEYCERKQITEYELYTDENFSGAKVSRPSLDRMMESVRKGEVSTVICYSFSRFARSTTHLLSALEEMKKYSTEFVSITEQIETNSPMGRAFFTVIAAISQLERELIVERVKNGLKNAKLKGIHIGRKKTRPSALIRTLRRSGLSYSAIAKITNVSEGAIGAELSDWRKELAQQSRTIADEMGDHAAEKLSKNVVSSTVTVTSETEPGLTITLDTEGVELELVR
jgi:DNA invertase Pin-like site-specific DNA recombinase